MSLSRTPNDHNDAPDPADLLAQAREVNATLWAQVRKLDKVVSDSHKANARARARLAEIRAETDRKIAAAEQAAAAQQSGAVGRFIADCAVAADTLKTHIARATDESEQKTFDTVHRQLTDMFNSLAPRTPATPPAPAQHDIAAANSANDDDAPDDDIPAIDNSDKSYTELLAENDQLAAAIAERNSLMLKLREERIYLAAQGGAPEEKRLEQAQRALDADADYAVQKPFRNMLPLIDTLERRKAHAEKTGKTTLADGFGATLDALMTAFNKNGITRIHPLGQAFDDRCHEAMDVAEPQNGVAPDTVVDVTQSGYAIKNRIIRHARVVVAG